MILKLSLLDLLHDRLMSLCATAAMTAVVAPLLLLFSLRYGIVSSLENQLKSNPLNLEIRMLSGYSLDATFFESMRADPDVGFVVEMTRSLSVTANLGVKGKAIPNVEAIATAKGDPLLKLSSIEFPADRQALFLSTELAEDLGVPVGDRVKVAISRTLNGERQSSAADFKLAGIVRADLLSGKRMLMPLDAVIAMEDFRDGYEPEIFSDGSQNNLARKSFARARIYATSLESVERLSKKLRQHYSISDKLQEIEELKAITAVLNFIFITVAAVSVTGGIAALGGLIISAVAHRRRVFALLRVRGMSRREIVMMMVAEELLLGVMAFALSWGLTSGGTLVFNTHFVNLLPQEVVVAQLTPVHLMVAGIMILGTCAVLALGTTYFELGRHDVAQAIRES